MKVLDLGCGDGTTAVPAAQLGADVLGVDIASNLSRRATHEPRSLDLTNLLLRGRRRLGSERTRRRELRPRGQRLRGDVRSEAVRRRHGDGPGDQARRPDRDGQLDPGRPDAGRPDPEDQRLVRPAAPGGLRQPGHLGRGGERDRAVRRRPASPRTRSRARGTRTCSTPPARRRNWSTAVQDVLRPDDERVRGGGGGRPRGRPPGRARDSVQRAEHER